MLRTVERREEAVSFGWETEQAASVLKALGVRGKKTVGA